MRRSLLRAAAEPLKLYQCLGVMSELGQLT